MAQIWFKVGFIFGEDEPKRHWWMAFGKFQMK
jgi:hypothetical protein